jgi:hypothetical protein
LEIREHAKLRYVQRVMGIHDYREAQEFIKKNEYLVSYKVLEFYNDAKLLYKSYAPTRKETLDYYTNKDFMIVVHPKGNEIVTLYNMTLQTEDDINQKLIKEYVNKITKNNKEINKIETIKKKQDKISCHLEYMIGRLKGTLDVSEYQVEFAQSIDKCKEYAAEQKKLRMENREMMTQLFRKI